MSDIQTELSDYCKFYVSQYTDLEKLRKRATNVNTNLTIWKRLFETKNMNKEVELIENVEPKVKIWIDAWDQQSMILLEIINKIKKSSSFDEAQEFAVAKMDKLEQLQQLEMESRPMKEIDAIEKAGKKIKNFEKELQKITLEDNPKIVKKSDDDIKSGRYKAGGIIGIFAGVIIGILIAFAMVETPGMIILATATVTPEQKTIIEVVLMLGYGLIGGLIGMCIWGLIDYINTKRKNESPEDKTKRQKEFNQQGF